MSIKQQSQKSQAIKQTAQKQIATPIESWIFDLDNTLYSGEDILFGQIKTRITDYISRYLALHPRKALALQKQYLQEYGTSLSGMMAVHGMDPADFLDYVHDVDLVGLKPCLKLQSAIKNLPGRKFIFTNGSRGHAKNIATHLGLYHLFDGVYAIEDMNYTPKPKHSAYEGFNKEFAIEPMHAIMFEDTPRNLQVPKAMGMKTVLIEHDFICENEGSFIDYRINDLADWLIDFSNSY